MRTTGICPACGKEIIMQATCPQCNFNIEIFFCSRRNFLNTVVQEITPQRIEEFKN